MQLEGIVSKRVDSIYRSGRTKTWIKAKAKRNGTFTIVGYTTSKPAGGLAALFLAENGKERADAGRQGRHRLLRPPRPRRWTARLEPLRAEAARRRLRRPDAPRALGGAGAESAR